MFSREFLTLIGVSMFQLNDKDDESISEAESDVQEADLQVANDMFSSTENLPQDTKEEQDDIIDERNDNIVSIEP